MRFYYYIALTKPYIGLKFILSRRTQAENSKYKCAIARACLNVKIHVNMYSFYFGLHCSYIISFLEYVVNGWDSYFGIQHYTFLYICNLPTLIAYIVKQQAPPAIYLSLEFTDMYFS